MKVSGKILLCILVSSGFCAARCEAAVYHSTGSVASVQALHNAAHDGDTITLPAGTFTWTSQLEITKGITLEGATTIVGPASTPTVADATIILDNTPRAGRGGVLSVELSPNQSFRLTGVTFRRGSSRTYGNNGAIRVTSTGSQPNKSVRIDHCHFDHLYWGCAIAIFGWIYGVDDHNVFDCNPTSSSHLIWHNTWGGRTNGNGSWADFPYYGTERFWFIEDNTIRGAGTNTTSGTIDCVNGGRYVARHNFFSNSSPGGHGTEGGVQRGAREREVYDNSFHWTIAHPGHLQRSGGGIWHDNSWTGLESASGTHTILAVYREVGAIGNDLSNWGLAGGNNHWDVNDPHGLYESGAASASSAPGTLQDSSQHWTPNQWAGYSVTNTDPTSPAYRHSSYILSNTSNTITYYFYSAGDRGAPLVFHAGDTYKIYRVLTALDQNGRGKGDLISADSPPRWPNEALEPCFSWNNVHLPTGHAHGFGSPSPTQIANRDYYNLGSGFPGDSTPAQVAATYRAALNGVDYVRPYVYPHPLVLGVLRAIVSDFNGDGSPDFVLQNARTHQTAIWYLDNNVWIGSAYGPTLPNNWGLRRGTDFNGDSHSDYVLLNTTTDETGIWYLSGATLIASAYGPSLPGGWELVATADFNGDGYPDYSLYNASTHQTAIWYLNNNVWIGSAYGPTLPNGWNLIGVADFDRDGHTDYLLFHPTTGYTAIWYLSGPALTGGALGPTVQSGWVLVATADFDGDGNPDYLLYNGSTYETAIWYLNNNVFVGSASGPTLPAAWSWVGP